MRGEHTSVRVNATRLRWIIPACAGNTSSFKSMQSSVRDHPRMRGEHVGLVTHVGEYKGSSPHARGTLYLTNAEDLQTGIIPACAGNTHARD